MPITKPARQRAVRAPLFRPALQAKRRARLRRWRPVLRSWTPVGGWKADATKTAARESYAAPALMLLYNNVAELRQNRGTKPQFTRALRGSDRYPEKRSPLCPKRTSGSWRSQGLGDQCG